MRNHHWTQALSHLSRKFLKTSSYENSSGAFSAAYHLKIIFATVRKIYILHKRNYNNILRFWSIPVNLSITSSSESMPEISLSIDKIAKSVSRCSHTMDRRWVFILFNAEKDHSQWAVLTAIVIAILMSLISSGKASFNGISDLNTSGCALSSPFVQVFSLLILSPCQLILCRYHKRTKCRGERNFSDLGLQAWIACIISMFFWSNRLEISAMTASRQERG